MVIKNWTLILGLFATGAWLTGCEPPATEEAGTEQGSTEEHDHEGHDHEGHEHPTVGPHDGDLIELGDHEYLAEMVHDDKSVTIYLFEHDAKTPVPIADKELIVSLLHDGTPEEFPLAASPVETDPSGQSSRFTADNADLASHVVDEASEPQLMVTIKETPYTAPIAHSHEHGDHDHDHAGHDHEGDDHAH